MSSTLAPTENDRIFVPINEKGEALTHLAVILPANYPSAPTQSDFNNLIMGQLIELSKEISLLQLNRWLEDFTGRTDIYWGRNNEEIIDRLILEWNYTDMFDDVDWNHQKPTPPEIQKKAKDYLSNELHIMEFLSFLK